jgi:hypothetical protein
VYATRAAEKSAAAVATVKKGYVCINAHIYACMFIVLCMTRVILRSQLVLWAVKVLYVYIYVSHTHMLIYICIYIHTGKSASKRAWSKRAKRWIPVYMHIHTYSH